MFYKFVNGKLNLYTNMDQAVASLNDLLVDLRLNPGRYLTVEIF